MEKQVKLEKESFYPFNHPALDACTVAATGFIFP